MGTTAERIGPRTIRVTFGVTPTPGNSLQFNVTDLAGNASGAITRTITAADGTAPLVSSVAGTMVSGSGGDFVTVTFNEPVDTVTALDASSYVVHTGATTLSMTGAVLSYSGNTNAVTIAFAAGQELVSGAALTVTVSGVSDLFGNAMASAVTIGGLTSGDASDPAFDQAFVNYRADAAGAVIDVQFSEDVDTSFVSSTSNWTATGIPTPTVAPE